LLLVAGTAGYGWWASELRPFAAVSYVAFCLPVAALALYARLDHSDAHPPTTTIPTRRSLAPWIGLVATSAVLETVALAQGGRAAGFPTVSTVLDRALAHHAARFALVCVWLAIGAAPLANRERRRR
jgi:hypothetical protein